METKQKTPTHDENRLNYTMRAYKWFEYIK